MSYIYSMKLIVFSAPGKIADEAATLLQMFELGLAYFHLRKPGWSIQEHQDLLNQLPTVHHSKIVLHHHHSLLSVYSLKGIHFTEKKRRDNKRDQTTVSVSTSFHHLQELIDAPASYEYVFLSPIFDSISKQNYKSPFQEKELTEFLTANQLPVVALGGISRENIQQVQKMGFIGAAVLGSIWQSSDPVSEFTALQTLLGSNKKNDG